jgi:hypothetical protein
MKVLQLLVAAHDWLSDPEHWCKGDFGFDSRGMRLSRCEMANAVKCCALGAMMKFSCLAGKEPNGIEYLLARNHLCNVLADHVSSWASITTYNDSIADHEALLNLYKLAIKKREEWEATNGTEEEDRYIDTRNASR